MAIVNEAEERLIIDPLAPEEGWWGQWMRMAFTVSRTEPTIVTPQGIARIIVLDVCKTPVRINNQFFEFLQFGPGFQPRGCDALGRVCGPLAAYERETVTTFVPLLPTPQIIRAYASDPVDVGRTALVQGKDANNQTVRFLDALANATGLGERIVLGDPFTDTTNQFSEITGVQKQKTFGEVQFFQVDPATLVETPLLTMQPYETTAAYRKYYINGLPSNCCDSSVPCGTLQVLAMVKLDFVPVQCDSDYLNLGCVPALIEECQAVRYGRIDTPGSQQLSALHHTNALRLLFGRLQHFMGNEQPAIHRRLFGSDRMRLQPL